MEEYQNRWIVITGGAGFIGSATLRYLNDQGVHKIVLIDDLGRDEKWRNLVGKTFHEIVPIVQTFDWLDGKEKEIGAIIHLGACSSTVETNADFMIENNTHFSMKLATYAIQNDIRFIYASSAATYGDGSLGFSDDHAQLESLAPLNIYGYSKHLFDLWLKKNGWLDKVVGLKYFNVFGPNENHKGRMASAVKHLLPQIQKEGAVRLFKSNDPERFADGDQCRDFIYVKDAVRMTCAFLQNEATGIFNIGTGKPSTWKALARAMFLALGLPEKIEYIPLPADLHSSYQNYTRADVSKTAGQLGQDAFCESLENAVADYLKNYLVPGKLW